MEMAKDDVQCAGGSQQYGPGETGCNGPALLSARDAWQEEKRDRSVTTPVGKTPGWLLADYEKNGHFSAQRPMRRCRVLY